VFYVSRGMRVVGTLVVLVGLGLVAFGVGVIVRAIREMTGGDFWGILLLFFAVVPLLLACLCIARGRWLVRTRRQGLALFQISGDGVECASGLFGCADLEKVIRVWWGENQLPGFRFVIRGACQAR
jgi:hypothetical protein